MPLRHKSAQKRARQTITRTERNKAYKALVKRSIKNVLEDTNKASAEEKFKQSTRVFDRASVKGIIHKNKAARIKARLSKHINNL